MNKDAKLDLELTVEDGACIIASLTQIQGAIRERVARHLFDKVEKAIQAEKEKNEEIN